MGDSITLVCGTGSHSVGSDGFESGLPYRGKFSAELAAAMMMITTAPMCPVPMGRVSLSKKTLTSYGVVLMKWLYEYESFRAIQKRPDFQIAGLPGFYVREYLVDMGWLLKGLTNLDPIDLLHPYENMKCFRRMRSKFYSTGVVPFCDCTPNCLFKKAMFAVVGSTYDLSVTMSRFGVTFSVTDFVGKDVVDAFVRYCTTKPDCPGKFFPTSVIGNTIVLNTHRHKSYLQDTDLTTTILYGTPSF